MLERISQCIFDDAKKNNFSGYDPFDGLNSKILDSLPRVKKSLFGLAWIQFNKRSILNLRPLFQVPKKRNAKGVALFILGLLENYKRTQDIHYLIEARQLGDWLLDQQCDRTIWQHSCWGYHFDWNARAFYVTKDKPNMITTVYVAQALYQLGKAADSHKYIQPAFDSASFIVESLYINDSKGAYLAYIPGETAFVHNANLWGAAWLAHVANNTNNEPFKMLALRVARSSVREQREDGSWAYGTRHHHQFIDGFHTGYNLEALQVIKERLNTNEFDAVLEKGLSYYRHALFEQDGTAKYYNDNRYPLDMHSVAQAILTFLKVGNSPQDLAWIEKIYQRSVDTLYDTRKRRFIYQKYALFSNHINYMRWTQAWAYYSFSYLSRIKKQGKNK